MAKIDLKNEWSKIPGEWDRDYYINLDGDVRYWWESKARSKYDKLESRFRYIKKRVLKVGYGNGYESCVFWSNKVRKTQFIHRLLALTFIPNPENKPQVNHIDGNSRNNKIENLEWATSKENINHAWDNGLCASGKNFGRVTPEVIDTVKSLSGRLPQHEIGKIVNLHQSHVSRILNNKLNRSKKAI